jgi:Major Facilitator Superfamily
MDSVSTEHSNDTSNDGNFRTLLYARILRSVGISFSSVALPLYMSALGYSPLVIGISFLLMTLFGSFLLLLWGVVGDRFGYKNVLIIVEALFSCSAIIFAFAQGSNLILIVFAAVIGGYGGMGGGGLRGAFGPGMTALVGYLWRDPVERIRRLGRITFVAGLAGTAGYALLAAEGFASSFVGEIGAFRLLYFLTFFTGAGAIVLLSFIREQHHAPRKARIITKKSGQFVSRIVASNIVNGLGIGLAIPLLPLWFLLAFQYSATEISIIYVCSAIAGAIASYFAHNVSARIGAVNSASMARILNGVFLASMAFSPFGILAASLYVVRAISGGVSAPIRQAVTLQGVEETELGAASSLSGLSVRASFMSSGLGGYLLTLSESLPLELGGALQICGGAIFYKLLHHWQDKVNQEKNSDTRVLDQSL